MVGVVVDVYWTDLDADAGPVSCLLDLLDGPERARADRFRFERDRHRFILRRGRLRTLLAGHLGCNPVAIQFTQNSFGKPALHGSDLQFNVSHSQGVALIAVARGAELGCDIERCDERIDVNGTAGSLFAPGELRMLERLPPRQRQGGFFRCWTRKEAYVKALGLGLSHRLDGFDTSSFDGRVAGWLVRSFMPRPLYHAAVAVQGERMKLALRPYQTDGRNRNVR